MKQYKITFTDGKILKFDSHLEIDDLLNKLCTNPFTKIQKIIINGSQILTIEDITHG